MVWVTASISCNTDDTPRVYIPYNIRFPIKSLECDRIVSHLSLFGNIRVNWREASAVVATRGRGKQRKCANTRVVILVSLLMLCECVCVCGVIQHWFGGLISCLFISHFDIRNDFNYISPTHTHIHSHARARFLRKYTHFPFETTENEWVSHRIFYVGITNICFNRTNLFALSIFGVLFEIFVFIFILVSKVRLSSSAGASVCVCRCEYYILLFFYLIFFFGLLPFATFFSYWWFTVDFYRAEIVSWWRCKYGWLTDWLVDWLVGSLVGWYGYTK